MSGAEEVVTGGWIGLGIALAVALVLGMAWRRGNGRMRTPRPVRERASRPVAESIAGEVAPTAERAAAERAAAERAAAEPAVAGPRVTAAEIGAPLGGRATLLQFSSAFCAPCRATRRILIEVTEMVTGTAHVEIDAESHLDLVRRLDIRRTPTVLVLGPDGLIVKRASGQPRKADVIAALGEAGAAAHPKRSAGLSQGAGGS